MSTSNSQKTMTLSGRKYNVLSKGANGTAIELSATECAKVFELGEAQREADLMKIANSINNLVCHLIRVEVTQDYSSELLIMERVYPLQYRALTIVERERLFDIFLLQLKELHSKGFAHWDVKRPSHVVKSPDRFWDNIILTPTALRLIDTGNSVLRDDADFDEACLDDIRCANEFKKVLLTP